jgi:hypothetical protein
VCRRNTHRARRSRSHHQRQLLQQLQSGLQPRIRHHVDRKRSSRNSANGFDRRVSFVCGGSRLSGWSVCGVGVCCSADHGWRIMLRRVLFVGKLIPCAYTSLFTDNLEETGAFLEEWEPALGLMALLVTENYSITLLVPWYSEPHFSHTLIPEALAQGSEIT